MRRMSKNYKIITLSIVLLLATLFLGCGSSTRNDQGVSFTFFGWFADSTGTLGLSTIAVPIAGPNPETGGFGDDVIGYAGLQNNLLGQFIRIERLHHQYSVPGSSVRIPDTSVGVPGTLGAAGPSDSSTLPDATATLGNVGYFGALIVPRSVREFISLNRSSFPEPPFVLVVSTSATGVTSGGNRMNSNQLEIEVIIEPEIIIEPTTDEGDTDGGLNEGDAEANENDVDGQFNEE